MSINKQALDQYEEDTLELVQYHLDNKNPKRAIQVLKTAQEILELISRVYPYKNIHPTGLEA